MNIDKLAYLSVAVVTPRIELRSSERCQCVMASERLRKLHAIGDGISDIRSSTITIDSLPYTNILY